MEPESREKKQKIDTLNEELYHKNKEHAQRKRRKIHSRDIKLDHDFDDEDTYKLLLEKNKKRKLPPSLFKKIFLIVLGFFTVTALIAAFSVFDLKQRVSDDLISMEIIGPPFVDGGDELELKVRIQNFNEQMIENSDLIVSYPKDSSRVEDEVFMRRSIGDVGNGQKVNEEFDLVLFGGEGDVRNIHATLEYRIEGSSSIFIKEADFEVVIRSTPTQITVTAPDEIVQNQEITLSVDLASNTNKQINDILMNIDYPLGFEFISSTVEPQYSSHTWYFPNITDEKQTIEITGRLSALPGQGQSFYVQAGKQDNLNKNVIETLFNSVTHTVDVQESFITAEMDINNKGTEDISIRGGDEIDVEIDFRNTLSETLADVEIIAHLDGDLYKADGIRVQNGDFDSNTKRIVWNKNNMEQLEFLEPGETGTLSFALTTKELVGQAGSLVNPTAIIVVDVSATEINGKVREAFAVSRADISANSDVTLLAKTLHNDGPFKNKGSIPPRVGQKTQYTVTLQVTNSSNDVQEAEVTTFLPPYVGWLGNIAPSVERQKIEYNQTTREVTWDLGTLKSGLGIGNANPKQVSFQVDVLPSLPHVGENLDITKDIILSGKDTFTDVKLTFKKSPISTNLKQEASAGTGDGLVSN